MNLGFSNEKEIVDSLNNFSQHSNINIQKLILELNNNKLPKSVKSQLYGGQNKADISITIDGVEYFISIKRGFGNSVHQEKIEDFISYLKNEIEDNNNVFDDIRFYIWGDGSLDGTNPINKRINSNTIKAIYPEKVINIQNYFDKNKILLLNRFLITGKYNNKINPDYLLYGDKNNSKLLKVDKVLKFAINYKRNKLRGITIGCLNFQTWNRSINGGQENKRGSIQLKWPSLSKDIKELL